MQNLHQNIITKRVPEDGVFIGDCPNEILSSIFLNVPYGTKLVNIARVHERFKAEALPILYRSIQLRADQMSDNHYFAKGRHDLPAGLVSDPEGLNLRSFPSFCTHVQKLSLKVRKTNWYTNPSGHRKLLELLPRIKELTLNPPPWKYDDPVSDQLRTMRLNLPSGFADFRPPKLWPAYFDLNEYLSKPSLRNVQFDNFEEDRQNYKVVHTGNSNSSTIEDLRFINWHRDDVRVLGLVLPSIRRLKHFVIDVHGKWEGSVAQQMQGLAPHDYGDLLQLHNASLEQVIIAYCNDAYLDLNGQNFPRRESPVMGSLSGYPQLKRLAIPEKFLVTRQDVSIHQLLPPNLEELQIQTSGIQGSLRDGYDNDPDDIPYYHSWIETLAQHKNEFVPRLERVVWWFQMLPSGLVNDNSYLYTLNAARASEELHKDPACADFLERVVELGEMFQKVNVTFEVVLTRNFKRTQFAKYLYL